MSQYNKSVKICTNSPKGEYTLSLSNTKQTVVLTNNRAQYYAELAEKYKEEAKVYRDNAQYYAEQNSDVTYEYINTVKSELISQIETKQDTGDYALKVEIPNKLSDLQDDSNFAKFNDVVNRDIEIAQQINQEVERLNSVLETKVDKSSMQEVPCVIETYVNGFSWYRVYSDGWCEQGGGSYQSSNGGHRHTTVTLLKPFINTNYSISITSNFNSSTGEGTNYCANLQTTSFVAYICGYGFRWQACGYIA